MLILNANDVVVALPIADAIAAMKRAFTSLQRQDIIMPPRTHMSLEKHNAISLIMPSYSGGDHEALTVKVVGIFPNNLQQGRDRILGAVMVFDPTTGAPVAVLDGASLTGLRTAAASGAATDFLARRDSQTLGILGAGVQAKTHIQAMCSVRPIQKIKIYSPTRSKCEALVDQVRGNDDLPDDIEIVRSGDEAVENADIVCATTSANQAVFSDEAIQPGTHINAVGSSQTTIYEIPAATVVRSKVVVDQRAAAWEEAGDIVIPIKQGLITREHVLAELGELTSGTIPSPRSCEQDITFFKSVGLAVQDTFAAQTCLASAVASGLGQKVDW
jgi:ornithine cyclodeaminase/alanine dehydrogenase-like protein (mu-crystallin family)